MKIGDIKQYDKVYLKDGRTASIVEIFGESGDYLADIDLPNRDWETVSICIEEIEKVIV